MDTTTASPLNAAPLPGVLRHLQRMTGYFTYDGQNIPYVNIYSTPRGRGPHA